MWRTPTKDDLIDSVSEKEIGSYDNAASPSLSARPRHESVIARTVAFVRGYIASSPKRITLSTDKSMLPDSLIAPAMDYAAISIIKRSDTETAQLRQTAADNALKLFQSIAEGKFTPESYDGAAVSGQGAVELAASSRRRVTSASLEGTP